MAKETVAEKAQDTAVAVEKKAEKEVDTLVKEDGEQPLTIQPQWHLLTFSRLDRLQYPLCGVPSSCA